MRDLLEKILKMGLTLVVTEEENFPVLRLYRCSMSEIPHSMPVASCSLTPGTFRETSEDAIQAMILELERRPVTL